MRSYQSADCLSLTAKGVKERGGFIFIFYSQPCADSPSFAVEANLSPFGIVLIDEFDRLDLWRSNGAALGHLRLEFYQ